MSADRSRPLSYFAASTCENATHPRCRCRCGGKLHGAKRGPVEQLPPDDPHHAEPGAEEAQTSLLEALDMSDVLERLETARRPNPLAAALMGDPQPTEEQVEAWLVDLRTFVEGGQSAQQLAAPEAPRRTLCSDAGRPRLQVSQ